MGEKDLKSADNLKLTQWQTLNLNLVDQKLIRLVMECKVTMIVVKISQISFLQLRESIIKPIKLLKGLIQLMEGDPIILVAVILTSETL